VRDREAQKERHCVFRLFTEFREEPFGGCRSKELLMPASFPMLDGVGDASGEAIGNQQFQSDMQQGARSAAERSASSVTPSHP
jgi:hypothetical protein